MEDRRDELALHGENLACAHLVEQGWDIVDRNVTWKLGEIDVVARKALDGGELWAIVEVKTRRGKGPPYPEDNVTAAKRRKLAKLGQLYLQENRLYGVVMRFDVIGIDVCGEEFELRHHEAAFDAWGRI